jgi:hypothetical protein
MPHLSPTHHETSKHVSPHKTDSRELAKKVREEERDKWFEEARPMAKPVHIWREKRLSREEKGRTAASRAVRPKGQGPTTLSRRAVKLLGPWR